MVSQLYFTVTFTLLDLTKLIQPFPVICYVYISILEKTRIPDYNNTKPFIGILENDLKTLTYWYI